MRKKLYVVLMIFILMAVFAGCATSNQSETAETQEASTHSVTASAELKSVSMQIKNIRSESQVKMVVFDIILKNTSSKPLRYNVTAFIPGVGAGADFIPAKDDAVIQPGEEMKGSVGVLTDSELFPTSFLLEITEE